MPDPTIAAKDQLYVERHPSGSVTLIKTITYADGSRGEGGAIFVPVELLPWLIEELEKQVMG